MIVITVTLCNVGGNVRFLAEQKAVIDVVNIMKQHEANAAVLQAAYAMVLSLLLQGLFDRINFFIVNLSPYFFSLHTLHLRICNGTF